MNPGGSFINLLKGGLTIQESFVDDVLAISYPLSTPEGANMFQSANEVKCSFTEKQNPISSIVNSAGEKVVLPTNIEYQSAACSSASLEKLAQKFEVVTKSLPIQNINAVKQLAATVNLVH